MNDARLNMEEEKTIVTASFKAPSFFIVFTILAFTFAVLFLTVGGLIAFKPDGSKFLGIFMILGGIFMIPIAIIMLAGTNAIRHCKCEVTNKRIKGVTTNFIAKKTYSYRLDEIDNVEVTSYLGISALALNFTQGHGSSQPIRYGTGTSTISSANTLRLSYIANATELYEKLSDLLTQMKNHEDVMVDIEMKKADAAAKQADAFEKMAGSTQTQKGSSSVSYIDELKQLKELLDNGIITQEEFDTKKAELLAKK